MNRRFRLVLFLFLVTLSSGQGKNNTLSTPHRKLLQGTAMEELKQTRDRSCSKADLVINQGATAPLPSGIPTYSVDIANVCSTGCNISGIHLSCGWFSSATLVNPKLFKRISYDDCLVNDGNPLVNGKLVKIRYANSFAYPLSVSQLVCS